MTNQTCCCLVNENCSWRFLPFLIDGLEKKSWRHHKNSMKLVRWRETQTANQVTGCCCKVTRETAEFTSPVYRGAELKRPSGAGDNSKNRNNATPSLHYRIFLSKSDLVTDCRREGLSPFRLFKKHCSKKRTGLLECHRAMSTGLHGKECSMFMKTQRSAEKTIYFLDNSAESILALFLCAPHSTVIHLYATGFIYTLQTFIKANLTG